MCALCISRRGSPALSVHFLFLLNNHISSVFLSVGVCFLGFFLFSYCIRDNLAYGFSCWCFILEACLLLETGSCHCLFSADSDREQFS